MPVRLRRTPLLAKLSPSTLRVSGLRTVARKVRKQNIRNYKIGNPEVDALMDRFGKVVFKRITLIDKPKRVSGAKR